MIKREFAELLVTRYLLTTDGDLEMWQNEPEEFVMEDLRGAWQENIQECSSVVLSTLSVEFPSIVPQIVYNKLLLIINGLFLFFQVEIDEIANKLQPNVELEAVLCKDACYLAVSTLAPRLHTTFIHFSSFFQETLLKDLHVNHPL